MSFLKKLENQILIADGAMGPFFIHLGKIVVLKN